MAKSIRTIGRSAVTGRIVSPAYVRTHPMTTTTETIRIPSKKR